MKAKGDYQDGVNSDQMVFMAVVKGKPRGATGVDSSQILGSQAGKAELHKLWPKDIQRKS